MNITVIKQDPAGKELWHYSGKVLSRRSNYLILEAFFNREDMDVFGLKLLKGDRFIEKFFFDKYYNIFEIHDRDDDLLKGWYCNICTPAKEISARIFYQDLALDLIVFPDGRQIILDQDEFAALKLPTELKRSAQSALIELTNYFNQVFGKDNC
jgi:protein associated with RNAse G/E